MLDSISKTVYDMFSSNHAKFHAFIITKVNNSALFWTLAARLKPKIAGYEAFLGIILSSSYTVFSRGQRFSKSPFCLDNKVGRAFEGTDNDPQESFKSHHFWLHSGMAIFILI